MMKNLMNQKGQAGVYLIGFLIILAINIIIGGVATEYVIEQWVGYFKNTTIDVPFIPCAIGGLFVGQFTIPVAILTWIIMLVL